MKVLKNLFGIRVNTKLRQEDYFLYKSVNIMDGSNRRLETSLAQVLTELEKIRNKFSSGFNRIRKNFFI